MHQTFPPALYLTDEDFTLLEISCKKASEGDQLATLLMLGWESRQRNTQRALDIAALVEVALESSRFSAEKLAQFRGRTLLIRASAQWLLGDHFQAHRFVELAQGSFVACGCPIGQADAHWLMGQIAHAAGAITQQTKHFEALLSVLGDSDPVRRRVAELEMAWYQPIGVATLQAFSKIAANQFAETDSDPLVRCCFYGLCGNEAESQGDPGGAIVFWVRSFRLAQILGQHSRAIVTALRIGAAFKALDDYDSGLEWMQRALDMARKLAWPISIGIALAHTGDILRRLGKLDAALDMLQESIEVLGSPRCDAAHRAFAQECLADVFLARGESTPGFVSLRRAEQLWLHSGASYPSVWRLRMRMARAWLHRDPKQAREMVAPWLKREDIDTPSKIEGLRLLAEIDSIQVEQTSPGAHSTNAALQSISQALELSKEIDDFEIPAEMYEEAGEALARAGDFSGAYKLAALAISAHKAKNARDVQSRKTAMGVKSQIDHAHLCPP